MKQIFLKSITVMLFSLLYVTVAHALEVDGIAYILNESERTASVTSKSTNYSGDVVIPSTVTYEGITYTVTEIDSRAFYYSTCLNSIKIPQTIIKIGTDTFLLCTNLTKAEFGSIESLCNIDFENMQANPLYNAKHLYIDGNEVTNITIPDGVTSLNYTFFGGRYITSVTLPNSVTSIDYAFGFCSNLTSIVIPRSVTSMNGAFGGTGLQSVIIPNSVVSMNEAFARCENLTSVTIPASVNEINMAFDRCSSLISVTNFAATPQSCNDAIFQNIPNTCVLHVLPGSVEAYEANEEWSYWMKTIVGDAVIPEINIIDGANDEFTNASNMNLETITYTRNFSNTNWNALYVPFAMEYDDWAEGFVVARLNDVHQFDDDEDGEIDRTALESIKLKPGSSTEPNTPYLIKAKTTGEKTISLTNTTLYTASENSYDVTSWYTRFIFTGTYHTVTDMATQGHYALSGGGLKQATSNAVQLKPFRWYVDITDRNGAPVPAMANKPIYIIFDDGEETSIESINAEPMLQNGDVYTVSGVKVANDASRLSKGVYIKNGKKILVK